MGRRSGPYDYSRVVAQRLSVCLLRANNYEQLELTSVEIKQANDEILLAYLDGEMSMARIRAIRNHLKICWKCRSVLADLESQAEAISRLLTANLDSEIDRSTEAKEKFLRWRKGFENRRQFFLRSLPPQLLRNVVRVAFAQTEGNALLYLPV